MTQHYLVVKQEPIRTRHGGHQIIKITLIGLDDRDEYKTYIDPTNYNCKNWTHVINHAGNGFILSGLKTKAKNPQIINADSDPVIAHETIDQDQLFDEIKRIWREDDQKARVKAAAKNNFGDLFEFKGQ